MDRELTIELIRIAPTIIWILIACFLLIAYRRPIGEMLSRIGSIKAFGVEAQFAQAREQLINASQSYGSGWDENEVKAVIQRADRIRDWLDGSRILWVDDHYLANATIYRFLNAYGVMIDGASTTDEAFTALRWAADAYEVIVSDMVRGQDTLAGIKLIEGMKAEGIKKPVILFVAQLDPTKGTPPGAVAITDSPIELIHHIMNVIESSG